MRRTNGKSLRNSFRPLAGIMVLISDFDPDDSSGIHVRFRPLAGIMVLIADNDKEIGLHYFMFPSPCGDYGSYRFYIGQRPSSGQDRRKLHLYVDLERLT